MDQRQYTQKMLYLHAKRIEYLVRCPPCQVRGYRATCHICDGRGKVPPEIAERLSTERDGEGL